MSELILLIAFACGFLITLLIYFYHIDKYNK